MRGLLRALLAGWGARKMSKGMGCGCFGTAILFLVLFWLLGMFM